MVKGWLKSVEVICSVIVVIFMATIALPSYMKSRETSSLSSCINHLRQIEAGKEQWALENSYGIGKAVIISEVNSYIKGGHPICPHNGSLLNRG